MRCAGFAAGSHRTRRRFGVPLVVLLLVLRQSAWAAPADSASSRLPPTDPVLATLIEQSLAARPELAQAQATASAERERVRQAGALPDPMLQLGVQNDGFTGWEVGKSENSFYSVMGSQTLPWPGKLRLRSQIAELGANQADQNVARVRLSTEAEVRRAYLGLLFARDRLALLDRLADLWHKSATVARTRYETGQGVQSDVLRAQLELNRIKQRRWALQAEADTAVQALNRLRGHPLDEPIETSIHLVDLAVPALGDDAAAVQDALERSPELAAARLGMTQAERLMGLAKKSSLPDLTVNVAVMPRGGEFPPMWLVNVGGPLPLHAGRKQSRAIAEGKARFLASERNIDALEQVLRLRVAQRRTTLAAALETIGLYKGGLLVQSQATADSTLTQYAVGKVTFASVLEATVGLIADEEGYLQALAQAQRLQIDAAEVSLVPPSSSTQGTGTAAMPGAGGMGGSAAGQSGGAAAPTSAGSSSSSMPSQ
jgi:outer membrane protein, heavy metal efflux system